MVNKDHQKDWKIREVQSAYWHKFPE